MRSDKINPCENYSEALNALKNIERYRPLSAEVFRIYSWNSVDDLLQFLQNNSQRGGYIKSPWNGKYVVLPFLDDSQNRWLRFDLQVVREFFYRVKLTAPTVFTDFVELQEYIQREYWSMPPYSEIMIKVPIFGCWDRSEFISTFLECQGYNIERLYFYGNNIQRGHSLCIYHDKDWKTCDITNCFFAESEKAVLYERIFRCLSSWNAYSNSNLKTLVKISKPPAQATTRVFLQNVANGIILMQKEQKDA